MAQIIETFSVEGDYRPLNFVSEVSTALAHGHLYKLRNTCGVIFVADKIDPLTGCRDTLEVVFGETGVLVYHCENIRVPKAAVAIMTGAAIYWDGVHGTGVTDTYASGLLWIGIAKENRDADDDDILIDLKGDKALMQAAP